MAFSPPTVVSNATFPSLTPLAGGRRYTPPEIPGVSKASTAGITTIRLFGSIPIGAQLSFDFLVNDDSLQDILECYWKVRGWVGTVNLPTTLFADASADLRDYLAEYGGSIKWAFAKGAQPQPTPDANANGLHRITCSFVSQLRTS